MQKRYLFDREQLEILAGEKVSQCFGEQFTFQDNFKRQVRMPQPPFLLADRIVSIDADPLSMTTGEIISETDVRENSWYCHHDYMPMGIMIEAGQADLLLISWLGVDEFNKSERIYRLLGCDLTLYGGLPDVGDTLRYHIRAIGHSTFGDIRLFFFEYDCYINDELRMSVRSGQAGFFTDQELANSQGILVDYADVQPTANSAELPTFHTATKQFSRQQINACSEGEFVDCFGQSHRYLMAHSRSPNLIPGDFQIFENLELDFQAGFWQRGYARAVQNITADDWFFKGHFKNDPCMPGTLMFECGIQLIKFYMIAAGMTIECDGARFELVANETYKLLCRGQVTPSSKQAIYEIDIECMELTPIPRLHVHLMVTADGLKAFYTKVIVQLTPQWLLKPGAPMTQAIATSTDFETEGFNFDYQSFVACMNGKPSAAFGEMYKVFDSHRKVARLPGYNYHFISRVRSLAAEQASFKAGGDIELEYEVPIDAWYFFENDAIAMPYCVLCEVVLQPCGWFASYLGCALQNEEDLKFRNLDGKGIVYKTIRPQAEQSLSTKVKLTSLSPLTGVIILNFEVECYLADELCYQLTTSFGFFTYDMFEDQAGLPQEGDEVAKLTLASDTQVDLHTWEKRKFLAADNLLMIDRITGFNEQGGKYQQAWLRVEKDVRATDWYFKAHFFQDPVQPGSLGLQAFLQVLQCYALLKGYEKNFNELEFSPILENHEHNWKYRGQIVPTIELVTVLCDIKQEQHGEKEINIIAELSFWNGDKKIYFAEMGLALREKSKTDDPVIAPYLNAEGVFEDVMSLSHYPYMKDHQPTLTTPSIPIMSCMDRLALAARSIKPFHEVSAIKNIRIGAWVVPYDNLTLQAAIVPGADNFLKITMSDSHANEMLFSGDVELVSVLSPSNERLDVTEFKQAKLVPLPYRYLFHDDCFKVIKQLKMTDKKCYAKLDSYIPWADNGYFNHVLLDGIVQVLPHSRFYLWCDDIENKTAAFPVMVNKVQQFLTAPRSQEVEVVGEFLEYIKVARLVKSRLSAYVNKKLWLRMEVTELVIELPLTKPIGLLEKRDMARKIQFCPAYRLSRAEGDSTVLNAKVVKKHEFLPDMFIKMYQISGDLLERTRQIAIKEHFAFIYRIHPAFVDIIDDDQVHILLESGIHCGYQIQQQEDTFIVESKD